jgi:hypothetical protein
MADGWSSYIDSNQSDTDAPYGVVTDQIPWHRACCSTAENCAVPLNDEVAYCQKYRFNAAPPPAVASRRS